MGWGTGLLPEKEIHAVKMPVFSFSKLAGVDPVLGPEMKSTGEVLGIDHAYDVALLKAFQGAGYNFSRRGRILVHTGKILADETAQLLKKLAQYGFMIEILCHEASSEPQESPLNKTVGPEDVFAKISSKAYQMVIDLPDKNSNGEKSAWLRKCAVQHGIILFTSIDTVMAFAEAMEAERQGRHITYRTMAAYIG